MSVISILFQHEDAHKINQENHEQHQCYARVMSFTSQNHFIENPPTRKKNYLVVTKANIFHVPAIKGQFLSASSCQIDALSSTCECRPPIAYWFHVLPLVKFWSMVHGLFPRLVSNYLHTIAHNSNDWIVHEMFNYISFVCATLSLFYLTRGVCFALQKGRGQSQPRGRHILFYFILV